MRSMVWLATLWLGCSGAQTTPDEVVDPTTDPTQSTPQPPQGGLSLRAHDTFATIVVASWDQATAGEAHVEFFFEEGDVRRSPARTLEAGPHEELLLGIPYGVEVTANLVTPAGTSEAVNLQIDPALDGMPEADLTIHDESGVDPGSNYVFLSLEGGVGRWWALLLDRQARVVWANRSRGGAIHLHPRIGWHGNTLLLDHNRFWGGTYDLSSSTIDRIAIDGTVLESFDVPGHHHAFTDTPWGELAYGQRAVNGASDEWLAIASADGSVRRLWSCREWLDSLKIDEGCASNTVNYDPVSDTYLHSFYSLETVVEVDGKTGATNRWFGHVDGAYAFSPADSTFFWQHGTHYTDDGTLLTSSLTAARDEIVVREYRVNTDTQTLEEVFNFGVGDGVLGRFMGEAHRLGNGNTLHNSGSLARLRESTPDGTVVWDVQWPGREIGRSTFVSDLYDLAPPRP